MNITENNKLLAEFLGWNKGEGYTKEYEFYEAWGETVDQVTLKEMKFDTDWNWLMEVVGKIESLEHCQITITKNWCRIEHAKHNSRIDSRDYSDDFTKILSVYNACVEFIKWHNLNKK